MNRLANKVIITTGGSRGIGRACAEACARAGAKIVVNYHSNQAAAREVTDAITKAGGEAIAAPGDVSRKADAERIVHTALDAFGTLTGLINNAGVSLFKNFLEVDEQEWDRTMAVNVRGPFLMMQAAANAMIRLGSGGRICNVTSISGLKATNPLQVPYCSSKGASNMLTKAAAIALAGYGITVNAILPGTIETDINREVLAEEGARKSIIEMTPLRRLGACEDVASLAVYLMSDESSWMTGSLIVIDGGFIA